MGKTSKRNNGKSMVIKIMCLLIIAIFITSSVAPFVYADEEEEKKCTDPCRCKDIADNRYKCIENTLKSGDPTKIEPADVKRLTTAQINQLGDKVNKIAEKLTPEQLNNPQVIKSLTSDKLSSPDVAKNLKAVSIKQALDSGKITKEGWKNLQVNEAVSALTDKARGDIKFEADDLKGGFFADKDGMTFGNGATLKFDDLKNMKDVTKIKIHGGISYTLIGKNGDEIKVTGKYDAKTDDDEKSYFKDAAGKIYYVDGVGRGAIAEFGEGSVGCEGACQITDSTNNVIKNRNGAMSIKTDEKGAKIECIDCGIAFADGGVTQGTIKASMDKEGTIKDIVLEKKNSFYTKSYTRITNAGEDENSQTILRFGGFYPDGSLFSEEEQKNRKNNQAFVQFIEKDAYMAVSSIGKDLRIDMDRTTVVTKDEKTKIMMTNFCTEYQTSCFTLNIENEKKSSVSEIAQVTHGQKSMIIGQSCDVNCKLTAKIKPGVAFTEFDETGLIINYGIKKDSQEKFITIGVDGGALPNSQLLPPSSQLPADMKIYGEYTMDLGIESSADIYTNAYRYAKYLKELKEKDSLLYDKIIAENPDLLKLDILLAHGPDELRAMSNVERDAIQKDMRDALDMFGAFSGIYQGNQNSADIQGKFVKVMENLGLSVSVDENGVKTFLQNGKAISEDEFDAVLNADNEYRDLNQQIVQNTANLEEKKTDLLGIQEKNLKKELDSLDSSDTKRKNIEMQMLAVGAEYSKKKGAYGNAFEKMDKLIALGVLSPEQTDKAIIERERMRYLKGSDILGNAKTKEDIDGALAWMKNDFSKVTSNDKTTKAYMDEIEKRTADAASKRPLFMVDVYNENGDFKSARNALVFYKKSLPEGSEELKAINANIDQMYSSEINALFKKNRLSEAAKLADEAAKGATDSKELFQSQGKEIRSEIKRQEIAADKQKILDSAIDAAYGNVAYDGKTYKNPQDLQKAIKNKYELMYSKSEYQPKKINGKWCLQTAGWDRGCFSTQKEASKRAAELKQSGIDSDFSRKYAESVSKGNPEKAKKIVGDYAEKYPDLSKQEKKTASDLSSQFRDQSKNKQIQNCISDASYCDEKHIQAKLEAEFFVKGVQYGYVNKISIGRDMLDSIKDPLVKEYATVYYENKDHFNKVFAYNQQKNIQELRETIAAENRLDDELAKRNQKVIRHDPDTGEDCTVLSKNCQVEFVSKNQYAIYKRETECQGKTFSLCAVKNAVPAAWGTANDYTFEMIGRGFNTAVSLGMSEVRAYDQKYFLQHQANALNTIENRKAQGIDLSNPKILEGIDVSVLPPEHARLLYQAGNPKVDLSKLAQATYASNDRYQNWGVVNQNLQFIVDECSRTSEAGCNKVAEKAQGMLYTRNNKAYQYANVGKNLLLGGVGDLTTMGAQFFTGTVATTGALKLVNIGQKTVAITTTRLITKADRIAAPLYFGLAGAGEKLFEEEEMSAGQRALGTLEGFGIGVGTFYLFEGGVKVAGQGLKGGRNLLFGPSTKSVAEDLAKGKSANLLKKTITLNDGTTGKALFENSEWVLKLRSGEKIPFKPENVYKVSGTYQSYAINTVKEGLDAKAAAQKAMLLDTFNKNRGKEFTDKAIADLNKELASGQKVRMVVPGEGVAEREITEVVRLPNGEFGYKVSGLENPIDPSVIIEVIGLPTPAKILASAGKSLSEAESGKIKTGDEVSFRTDEANYIQRPATGKVLSEDAEKGTLQVLDESGNILIVKKADATKAIPPERFVVAETAVPEASKFEEISVEELTKLPSYNYYSVADDASKAIEKGAKVRYVRTPAGKKFAVVDMGGQEITIPMQQEFTASNLEKFVWNMEANAGRGGLISKPASEAAPAALKAEGTGILKSEAEVGISRPSTITPEERIQMQRDIDNILAECG